MDHVLLGLIDVSSSGVDENRVVDEAVVETIVCCIRTVSRRGCEGGEWGYVFEFGVGWGEEGFDC